MQVLALLAMLAVGALPFPAPKLITVTDATKCDWGTVASVDTAKNDLVLTAADGPVTLQVGPATQVVSADGKPVGGIASVKVGASVRVYYEVDHGAQAKEIDLQK